MVLSNCDGTDDCGNGDYNFGCDLNISDGGNDGGYLITGSNGDGQ